MPLCSPTLPIPMPLESRFSLWLTAARSFRAFRSAMSVRWQARQASATPALPGSRSKGHGFCFDPALVEGRSVAVEQDRQTRRCANRGADIDYRTRMAVGVNALAKSEE